MGYKPILQAGREAPITQDDIILSPLLGLGEGAALNTLPHPYLSAASAMRATSWLSRYEVRVSSVVPHTVLSSRIGTA